jgi:hypothetical protein
MSDTRVGVGTTLPNPATSRLASRRGRAHRVLVAVELLTGGSALLCGALLALRPDGSLLGLPVRVLAGGPFSDWRLPGLLLGGLVGVGYLVAGILERGRYRWSGQLSVLAGAGLVVFEAVEWRWLGFHPLQAVFMVVGAAVVGLAVAGHRMAGEPPTVPQSPPGVAAVRPAHGGRE